jgi:hypothetical protein
MKFLAICGIGFLVIGVVFGFMNYYLRVDREGSRRMADHALREFCLSRGLSFTADHQGVAAGSRNRYSWRVEAALLTPEDRVVEAEPFGRMVLRRHLPLKKTVLFDFVRDADDALVLAGFREELR